MTDLDMTETTRIANVPMEVLVFGRPTRRVRLPGRLIFVAALLGATVGCAASVPPPAVEAVGQLAAGPSVRSAPVHPDTDLSPGFQAVEGDDDDATETVTTVTRAVDGGADCISNVATTDHDAELPEVAPKTDGVQVGEVRR